MTPPVRRFTYAYQYEGKTFELEIPAYIREEADERLFVIQTCPVEYDGEIIEEWEAE